MYRLGFLAMAPLLLLTPLTPAGGDKKKPEEKKLEGKKKPPRIVIARIELKDGSNLSCLFPPTQTVTIRSADAGTMTLKLDAIRFLDAEGDVHRIGTHTFDTFYGVIQTAEWNVRVLASQQDVTLQRGRVKRIVFPERPRVLTLQ